MWLNFWRDFASEEQWRFPEVAPWQIERSLGNPLVDQSERVRAEWMWWRRPRGFLREDASTCVLLITISVLLLGVPVLGVLLDAVWLFSLFPLIALDIVRNTRWRRDYEVSLRRMIRTGQRRESR